MNAIPANYVDLTSGGVVFRNGAWGPLVNGYVTMNRAKISGSNIFMGSVSSFMGKSVIDFTKSLNMTQVSKVQIVISSQSDPYPRTSVIVYDRSGTHTIYDAIEGEAKKAGTWNFVIPQEYRNKGHIWFKIQTTCSTQTTYYGPYISKILLLAN